jgi:hypothetical protein
MTEEVNSLAKSNSPLLMEVSPTSTSTPPKQVVEEEKAIKFLLNSNRDI